MKQHKALTDTEKQLQAPKRGGYKALRTQRRKAYYSARPSFTALNKKRRMGAHLRAFPEDVRAVEQFSQRYGAAAVTGHLASPVSHARKRIKRRQREAKRLADIRHEHA